MGPKCFGTPVAFTRHNFCSPNFILGTTKFGTALLIVEPVCQFDSGFKGLYTVPKMAADYETRRRKALAWYFLNKKMKRKADFVDYEYNLLRVHCLRLMKRRRLKLLHAILACIFYPRTREVWMRPRSFAWFEMAETHFTDDQWYENFRVTKGTFTFLLSKVNEDISYGHGHA